MALRRRLSPGLPLSDVVLHIYYSTNHLAATYQEGHGALQEHCTVTGSQLISKRLIDEILLIL
jgi:hypothetical protein